MKYCSARFIYTQRRAMMKTTYPGFNAPFVLKKQEDAAYSILKAAADKEKVYIEYEMTTAEGRCVRALSTEDMIYWHDDSFPSGSFSPAGMETEIRGRDGKTRHLTIGDGLVLSDGAEVCLDEARIAGEGAAIERIAAVSWEKTGYSYLFSSMDDSIIVHLTADGRNFLPYLRDRITYPEFGVVYDGDYYKPLPFSQYIHPETIPTGTDVFDVRDFGAVNDTGVVSTPAFQAAFDAARDNGGGTVLVTGGYYTTGTLEIPSNTTLFISIDSAVCASKDLTRFRNMFVGCIDAENVTIRGGGKIICNGEYFVYPPKKRPLLDPLEYIKLPPEYYDSMGYPTDSIRYAYRRRIRYAIDSYSENLPPIPRPMNNVWIRGSRNILLENIIVEGAFEWSINLEHSSSIRVHDVVVNDNRHVANTDGIDVTSCTDVEISHCFVSCADDGLCMKAPNKPEHDGLHATGVSREMGPTRHVRISDCTVLTVMNAFKIGTGTYHDIEDVVVENCTFMLPDIYPGAVSGISIECADGGNVKDITLRNIEMKRVCCPIFICQNMRNCDGFENEEAKKKRYYGGQISNILIENVTVEGEDVPCIITGFEVTENGKTTERKVKDITIRNYRARYNDLPEVLDIREKVSESIRAYPESNSFGDVPAYGFYVRHAENTVLENVSVIPRSMNTRECIVREKAD